MTFDNCIVIDQLNMIGIHAVELVKARETLTDTLACMLIKLVNHKLQQLAIFHHLVFFLFYNWSSWEGCQKLYLVGFAFHQKILGLEWKRSCESEYLKLAKLVHHQEVKHKVCMHTDPSRSYHTQVMWMWKNSWYTTRETHMNNSLLGQAFGRQEMVYFKIKKKVVTFRRIKEFWSIKDLSIILKN